MIHQTAQHLLELSREKWNHPAYKVVWLHVKYPGWIAYVAPGADHALLLKFEGAENLRDFRIVGKETPSLGEVLMRFPKVEPGAWAFLESTDEGGPYPDEAVADYRAYRDGWAAEGE